MLAVLDHLGNRHLGALGHVEHVVAGYIDVLVLLGLEMVVHLDAATADRLELGGILGDVGALGAGGPDDRAGGVAVDFVVPACIR